MTTALLGRSVDTTTSRFKPHLLPVPDSEPPLSAFLDENEQAPALSAVVGPDRIASHAILRSRACINRQPVVIGPPMTHRRWASGIDVDILRSDPRNTEPVHAGAQSPAPLPFRVHSAVGIISCDDAVAPIPAAAPPRAAIPVGATAPRPSATDAGTVLARATIEALSGRRPINQLLPHFTAGVFSGLQDFPMLDRRHQIQLVSIWVCEPAEDTAEISSAFRCGLRTRAMAMQLRSVEDRWYVTALQIG
ncbi:MAG: Rv3235 family protein [Nakamurella sp.]